MGNYEKEKIHEAQIVSILHQQEAGKSVKTSAGSTVSAMPHFIIGKQSMGYADQWCKTNEGYGRRGHTIYF